MRRLRSRQRAFAFLAFLAMAFVAFAPVASQLVRASTPSAPAWCGGHAAPAGHAMDDMGMAGMDHAGMAGIEQVAGHGGMSMDACGYCTFLAHHPGMPTVPVVLMRTPAGPPVSTWLPLPRALLPAPLVSSHAPRGPPALV